MPTSDKRKFLALGALGLFLVVLVGALSSIDLGSEPDTDPLNSNSRVQGELLSKKEKAELLRLREKEELLRLREREVLRKREEAELARQQEKKLLRLRETDLRDQMETELVNAATAEESYATMNNGRYTKVLANLYAEGYRAQDDITLTFKDTREGGRRYCCQKGVPNSGWWADYPVSIRLQRACAGPAEPLARALGCFLVFVVCAEEASWTRPTGGLGSPLNPRSW